MDNCITVFMVPKYIVQKIKEVNKEKIEKCVMSVKKLLLNILIY